MAQHSSETIDNVVPIFSEREEQISTTDEGLENLADRICQQVVERFYHANPQGIDPASTGAGRNVGQRTAETSRKLPI